MIFEGNPARGWGGGEGGEIEAAILRQRRSSPGSSRSNGLEVAGWDGNAFGQHGSISVGDVNVRLARITTDQATGEVYLGSIIPKCECAHGLCAIFQEAVSV